MSRSKWKGPYVSDSILLNVQNTNLTTKNNFKTVSKDFTILPKFVGFNIQIYNGKTFISLKIIDQMVGHKLGEFVPTRKQFMFKKNKKK